MDLKLGFDIGNLTRAKKRLLLVLLVLVIIALSASLFIIPALEERERLSAEVRRQNAEIQAVTKNAAKLSSLVNENEMLKSKLLSLQMQLPEEKEVSGLLKHVSETGIRSGLQIVSWKPRIKAIHPSKEVYEIPVDVEMMGNYHRFGQFFGHITKLGRIVNISNISIKPAEQRQNNVILHVSFTAMTYSFIPEKERKEMENAEKEKKK